MGYMGFNSGFGPSFGMGFGAFGVMFTIMFLLFVGIFVVVIARGISQWNKNNNSPPAHSTCNRRIQESRCIASPSRRRAPSLPYLYQLLCDF